MDYRSLFIKMIEPMSPYCAAGSGCKHGDTSKCNCTCKGYGGGCQDGDAVTTTGVGYVG